MVDVQSIGGSVAKRLSGLDIDLPVICRVGVSDDRVIALGGLAFWDGRCWLFFHVDNPPKGIIRQALIECDLLLRKAAQLGETEVRTTRDKRYGSSERLLKIAGFIKTDEVLDGQEVWACRV
jgi:hypothetical protein